MMKRKLKLIVQRFEGCPNGHVMITNAREAAAKLTDFIQFEEQLIETVDDVFKYSFRGSPTLLIDGVDYEGAPVPDSPGMSCRLYSNGIPSVEEIVERLNELLKATFP